jgi:UDP-glucose 4-epimerase
MKNIVVTGGCGYIGSHVARAFKQRGDHVTVIDQVQRNHTLKDVDAYFIGDFVSNGALSVLIHAEPDVIVHCAGTSLVGPSIDNPNEYWDNNVAKLLTFMDVVKTLPKKPLILFSSSASVYGEPEILPIPETHKVAPISPYGNTKATCERIFHDYYVAYAVPSVCFRYFNAAGAEPHNYDLGQEQGATHIVARILESAINKNQFDLYGNNYDTPDGTCIRDYVHVWDLARAHVMASNTDINQGGWTGAQIINLGTGQGISNRQIIDYVTKQYGFDNIGVMPKRIGDPAKLVASATQAESLIGWRPEFSDLHTIVDSAYLWYTRR